jgi:LysR family transcriptional regulator, hca operon transcriptional activator
MARPKVPASERLDGYVKRSEVKVAPRFEIDNFAMAMSLVTSERSVALLPISAVAYLPPTIVSRRLEGEQPTVDLMIGYRKGNA